MVREEQLSRQCRYHIHAIRMGVVVHGTSYTVAETPAGGYTTTSENASGTLEADTEAVFTNRRNMAIPTKQIQKLSLQTGVTWQFLQMQLPAVCSRGYLQWQGLPDFCLHFKKRSPDNRKGNPQAASVVCGKYLQAVYLKNPGRCNAESCGKKRREDR